MKQDEINAIVAPTKEQYAAVHDWLAQFQTDNTAISAADFAISTRQEVVQVQ